MIVYDTGALVAAERGNRSMWALHAATLRDGLSPLVPAGVLAQAWRGGPQANLSRLLAGCTITPLDGGIGRAVGALCASAGTADVVDASVLVVAQLVSGAIITEDQVDLRVLLDAAGLDLEVHQL